LEVFTKTVKNMKPHLKRKDIKKGILKSIDKKDTEREQILKKARKKAHSPVADVKRNISNTLRRIEKFDDGG
jgi:hypothetical protein